MGRLTYLTNFFKDRYVASLVPTFSWAVRAICSDIDFSRDLNLVEYGAGTGVFTKYLLSKLSPRSKLLAIERNGGMFNVLAKRINDSRLLLHNDSAERVGDLLAAHNIAAADYVISGIPFSLFPDALTQKIISATATSLTAHGEFIVYQCLWTTKQISVVDKLRANFIELNIRSALLNIPPLVIYLAKKPMKLTDT